MSVDLIRTLLESKFGKEKDPEAEDLSDKHLWQIFKNDLTNFQSSDNL